MRPQQEEDPTLEASPSRGTRGRWLRGAALAAALVLSGCSLVAAPHPEHSEHSAAAHGAGPSATSTPRSDAQDSDPAGPLLPADLSQAAQATARVAATEAVAAFAHPELPTAQWLHQLSPFLTLSAALAYQTVEPARIPARWVTGGASIESSSTGAIADLLVPTDAGPYEVVLQRQSGDVWLAQTITRAQPR